MLIRILLITIYILCTSLKGKEVPVGCLKVEIMLIADLSSSVGGKEQFIHDAVYTFIDKFELSENGIRIGLITFNSQAELLSPLSHYKDSLKIAASVIAPSSAKGNTNMTHALQLATQELIANGRQGVMKMAILITDGEPDNFNEAEQTATLLKSFPGTLIWGVFITKVPDTDTLWNMYGMNFHSTTGADNLKKLASPNCFIESDYNNLVEQVKKLDICL